MAGKPKIEDVRTVTDEDYRLAAYNNPQITQRVMDESLIPLGLDGAEAKTAVKASLAASVREGTYEISHDTGRGDAVTVPLLVSGKRTGKMLGVKLKRRGTDTWPLVAFCFRARQNAQNAPAKVRSPKPNRHEAKADMSQQSSANVGEPSFPETLRQFASLGAEEKLFKHLSGLEAMVPGEIWGERDSDKAEVRFRSLIHHLDYTYRRLRSQGRVFVASDGSLSAFDTGLQPTDNPLASIYAVFDPFDGRQPWRLEGFCRDDRPSGQLLSRMLLTSGGIRPQRATYNEGGVMELVYDPSKPTPRFSEPHAVYERFGRYPTEVIGKAFCLSADIATQIKADCMDKAAWSPGQDRIATLASRYKSPERPKQIKASLSRALAAAVDVAHHKAKANPNIARCSYYPTKQKMSFFLPLFMVDPQGPPDCVAVVVPDKEGYFVVTVLTCEMAAQNLRLVESPYDPWHDILSSRIIHGEPELANPSSSTPTSTQSLSETAPSDSVRADLATDNLTPDGPTMPDNNPTPGPSPALLPMLLSGEAPIDEDAISLLQDTSKNGNLQATVLLADCYRRGVGISPDMDEAVRLYRQAAHQDDPTALHALAICYVTGTGVSPDLVTAYELMMLAESFGDATAQVLVARCFPDPRQLRVVKEQLARRRGQHWW